MNNSKLVVIGYSLEPYFISIVQDGCVLPNIKFVTLTPKTSLPSKILFRISLLLGLYRFSLKMKFCNSDYAKLEKYFISPNYNFLFWSSHYIDWWFAVSKLINTNSHKCVFSWGPVENHPHLKRKLLYMKKAEACGFSFFSMNPFDVKKYKMTQTTQLYRFYKELPKQSSQFNFYFLGYKKGREKIVSKIETVLKNKKYTTFFNLFDEKTKPIPFLENVKNAMKSDCILDIVATTGKYKQNGMTLRPLEALFLGKKLLTNYAPIKECDFYHPDNIFIFDENNSLEGIEEFMAKPMHPISKEIVEQYEVNHWLQKYFLKNDQPT